MNASHTTRPAVAVVVVGYNDKQLVQDCLRSLREIAYAPVLVIYVDNESPDGSLDVVQHAFPEVIAIPSGGNLGYCGGNNVGITRALDAGARFLLILNPDTVICNPGFIATLVDYMLAHPDVGKVGPKVYLREYGVVQNTILGWPSITDSFLSVMSKLVPGERVPKSEAVTTPTEVPSLNGCCLLVRAEAWRDVGLYDTRFWCYMDEVDWDWQAAQAGWKRHYVPVESIIHLQKTAGYDFASQANYYMKRNTAMWYAKTGKYVSLAAWMVVTLLLAGLRAVFAPLRGRSATQYFCFVGRLASAYAHVIADLTSGQLHRKEAAVHPVCSHSQP